MVQISDTESSSLKKRILSISVSVCVCVRVLTWWDAARAAGIAVGARAEESGGEGRAEATHTRLARAIV